MKAMSSLQRGESRRTKNKESSQCHKENEKGKIPRK